jgi:hypothetical protein
MFKTLSTRLALAAVVTLASSGAMAAALDTGKASNGLTGIYSASFAGPLAPCSGSSPSYCSFFTGGLPSGGQIGAVPIAPNPTGVNGNVPGGIGPLGTPVAPVPGAGSSLNLTSDGITSTLAGGTITFNGATITVTAAGTTATVLNAGMVLDGAPQVAAVSGTGTSEFLVTAPVDFSRFSQVITGCVGALCPTLLADGLNLDMVRYRLFVQWDPTFTYFNSTFIGQTGNNSMVFANLDTVPVPAAVWLMGSALGLLGFARRKTAVA